MLLPMKNKKLIIGCSSAFIVLVAMVSVVVWLFYSRFIEPFAFRTETPAELRDPRIITGEGFLARTQFFTLPEPAFAARHNGVGSISDLVIKKTGDDSSAEIIIAGRYGALVVDQNGTSKSQVLYKLETQKEKIGIFKTTTTNTMLGDMQIVDLDGDRVFEYLARGSIDGAAVFDSQGERLWSYGKFTEEKTSIDDMAAGDLDGDGVAELVVVWDGLEVFDRHGVNKWRQETDAGTSHIEVVDTDGDGDKEIVYSSGGDLIIRDGKGQLVKQVDMPFYIGDFTICITPAKTQPTILAVQDGYVWLTDFKGKTVAKFNAPLSELDTAPYQTPVGEFRGTSVYKAKGAWVKFKKGEPEYLAIIAEFAGVDRSILYIYKSSGEIIYQEVLPEQCSAIVFYPEANANNPQEFLIAGERTIWRYKAR